MITTLKKNVRGDVAIYISVMLLTIMLSGVLVMSLILSRQIRATRNVLTTERAAYAAHSGLEDCLSFVQLWTTEEGEVKECDSGTDRDYDKDGQIDSTLNHIYYSGKYATYVGSGKPEPCIWDVLGNYDGLERRMGLGEEDCNVPST